MGWGKEECLVSLDSSNTGYVTEGTKSIKVVCKSYFNDPLALINEIALHSFGFNYIYLTFTTGLAPLVQKLDRAVHRINHYPVNKY